MKNTQQNVKDAILLLATSVGQKKNFEHLMAAYAGMPKIIEMVVYQLFLHKFDSRSCTTELYDAYKLVHDYATELQKEGFVKFEN